MTNETNELIDPMVLFKEETAGKNKSREYLMPYIDYVDSIGEKPFQVSDKTARAMIIRMTKLFNEGQKYIVENGGNGSLARLADGQSDTRSQTPRLSLTPTNWGNANNLVMTIMGMRLRLKHKNHVMRLDDIIFALQQTTGDMDIGRKIAKMTLTKDFIKEVEHHFKFHDTPPMFIAQNTIWVTKYVGLELISNYDKRFRDFWVDELFNNQLMENRNKAIDGHNTVSKLIDQKWGRTRTRMKALNRWMKNGMEWSSAREMHADAKFQERRVTIYEYIEKRMKQNKLSTNDLVVLGNMFDIDIENTNVLAKELGLGSVN